MLVLYVAITRAKCQLFILDDSFPQNPLVDLWRTNSLIEVSYQLHFAKHSTPEEWNERGEEVTIE
jgi:ATP-dependent exoDNAse (exonuclease V) beta subunit